VVPDDADGPVAASEGPSRSGERQGAGGETLPDSVEQLADSLPRALIAEGLAAPIAQRWAEAVARAMASEGPPIPRWSFDRPLQNALFDARRARRLVRGLEGAADVLATEAAGLKRARAAVAGGRRISRLLVVTTDGSRRFYREVERLRTRYGTRLEVIAVDVDEQTFGAALFGRGTRARAVLVTHKEPVAGILRCLAGAGPQAEAVVREPS
jgi:hypothetical protein